MTESVVLGNSGPKDGVSTNEQQRNTGPEPLVSSARGSPVFVSSTMTYTSQPNSSYDRSSDHEQRRVPVSGGGAA